MPLCATTCAPDPAASAEFLSRAGFEPLAGHDGLMSDGAALLQVDGARSARTGVRVWKEALPESVDGWLAQRGAVRFDGGSLLVAPSGTRVEVMDGVGPESPPSGRGRVLGNYAGLSIEAVDLGRSLDFWSSLLGAEVASGSPDQGWVSLRREGLGEISLMAPFICPHSFANPSLTYFNGAENPSILEDLGRRGVPFFERVGEDEPAVNAVLREPGGVGFFVFND